VATLFFVERGDLSMRDLSTSAWRVRIKLLLAALFIVTGGLLQLLHA
jgi:hypothetical protein